MKLYNTLTRTKDELKPLDDNTVKLYSCGLTVYDYPHIGNWVGYIYWDVLYRTLIANGYDVERVQNITDVGHLVSDDDHGEDKMEKGAKQEGLNAWQIADKYIAVADDEGYTKLGLRKPKLVRATEEIEAQIALVRKLEQAGYTYVIENDGVYFDTSKLGSYGTLARLDIDGLEAGKRVEIGGKHNPTDFALWKFSPQGRQRDMEWDSPWGKGFPGWHLECSAIAQTYLGDQIDIHTGGIDHIPIHHTNEIAQTETITGKPFANIWLHNNHLKVEGKKMSKSLRNVYTLSDIDKRGYSFEAFKVLVLSKHFQTEGNFTWDILDAAQNRLKHWQAVADLRWQIDRVDPENIQSKLLEALNDNLNTTEALKEIDLYCNRLLQEKKAPSKESLQAINELLGIDLLKPDIDDAVKAEINKRAAARTEKDWSTSDHIRDELYKQGILVRDEADTQIWSRL